VLEVFGTNLAGRLDLNIELPDVLEARKKKAETSRARLAILLIAASLICAMLVFFDRADAAAKVQKSEAKFLTASSRLRSQQTLIESKLSQESAMDADLVAAFKPAQYASDVVNTFCNAAPANLWISGITHERGKPALVRGTALNTDTVAAYVQVLAADPRLRDVKLVFANNATIEKTPVVQFSISAHVLGNMPLTSAFGTAVKK
jgi:Tfp pilus assembly protein PilN